MREIVKQFIGDSSNFNYEEYFKTNDFLDQIITEFQLDEDGYSIELEAVRNHRKLFESLIRWDPESFKYASQKLRSDKELVRKALEVDINNVFNIPEEVHELLFSQFQPQKDKDLVKEILKKDPKSFRYFVQFHGDKEFIQEMSKVFEPEKYSLYIEPYSKSLENKLHNLDPNNSQDAKRAKELISLDQSLFFKLKKFHKDLNGLGVELLSPYNRKGFYSCEKKMAEIEEMEDNPNFTRPFIANILNKKVQNYCFIISNQDELEDSIDKAINSNQEESYFLIESGNSIAAHCRTVVVNKHEDGKINFTILDSIGGQLINKQQGLINGLLYAVAKANKDIGVNIIINDFHKIQKSNSGCQFFSMMFIEEMDKMYQAQKKTFYQTLQDRGLIKEGGLYYLPPSELVHGMQTRGGFEKYKVEYAQALQKKGLLNGQLLEDLEKAERTIYETKEAKKSYIADKFNEWKDVELDPGFKGGSNEIHEMYGKLASAHKPVERKSWVEQLSFWNITSCCGSDNELRM